MRLKLYSITTFVLVFTSFALLATCTALQKSASLPTGIGDELEEGEGFDEFGTNDAFAGAEIVTISPEKIALAPLSDWQTRKFKGKTQYQLETENNQVMIRADSSGDASMLIKQQVVDLNKTPWVNWQWKIGQALDNPNEQEKKGDDFAARIYIAIAAKSGSLYPRALNYVWASQQAVDSYWPNPYTDNVVMVSVARGSGQQGEGQQGSGQQGEGKQGQWHTQKRNLKEDLQQFFGEEFNQIQGIAIMTDTDDTGQKATAWYRDIYFSEN